MATLITWAQENPKMIAEVVAFLAAIAYLLVEKYDLKRYRKALQFLTDLHENKGEIGVGVKKKDIAGELKHGIAIGKIDIPTFDVIDECAAISDPKKKVSKARRFWRRWLWPVVKTVAAEKIKKEINERISD